MISFYLMKLAATLKIIRPINLVITFFSVIIAAVISSSLSGISIEVILIAFSVTFSFAAGNVINDIIDFEIDKINRPERVLPQGLLTINFVKVLYVIFISLSLILATIISLEILIIVISLNLLLLLYSTHFKKVILFSNFVVAFATSTPLLLGSIAVHNINEGLIPAGFAFFTNFIREIVKDVEDIEGDRLNDIQTFPQVVGVKRSIRFIMGLVVLIIILDMFPFILGVYSAEYFAIIMTFVNPIFVYILKLLYNNTQLITLKRSSNLVKLNMILGLVAILIGAQ